jgi:hypothetical protein
VGPAERERDLIIDAFLHHRTEAGITVDLQHASELREMDGRMFEVVPASGTGAYSPVGNIGDTWRSEE